MNYGDNPVLYIILKDKVHVRVENSDPGSLYVEPINIVEPFFEVVWTYIARIPILEAIWMWPCKLIEPGQDADIRNGRISPAAEISCNLHGCPLRRGNVHTVVRVEIVG